MERRIEERFELRDRALSLQAKEYDRRLSDLNHEAVRILSAQEKSVSSERYEAFLTNVTEWRKRVDEFVNSSRGAAGGISQRWAIAIALLGIGTSGVAVLLTIFVWLSR